MPELKKLLEEGVVTPVVDRTYPLEETVAAMAYLQTGGGPGRIIITPHSQAGVVAVDTKNAP